MDLSSIFVRAAFGGCSLADRNQGFETSLVDLLLLGGESMW
jgi:hypothetical protein